MAFLEAASYSRELGIAVSFNVIIPQGGYDEPPKVLYLLHGLSDDHSMWARRTSVERYADAYNVAVIMPAANRSFYTDQKHGYKYFTYITEELPKQVGNIFRVAQGRENTFVAGLSMGGYGAFKLALTYPERYAKAASFSGALDMRKDDLSMNEEWIDIFGAEFEDNNDLMMLIEKIPAEKRPLLYQACGTNDTLYGQNQRFKAKAEALGYSLKYTEEPETHNWGYWDRQIAAALKWMFTNG